MKTSINRIVFLLIYISTVFVNAALAQKTYFVYLQSEQRQPFYVLNNSKNLSSSSIGYLILPKLTDGTYAIRIGFPNSPTIQDYDISVNGNDAGYLIKNLEDKGWALQNLQNGDLQVSGIFAKKRQELADAERVAREKRVADSLAQVFAAKERARKADSVQAVQMLAQQHKTADSLQALAQQRVTDSIHAETAKLEAAKRTEETIAKKEAAEKAAAVEAAILLEQQQKEESLKASTAKKEAAEKAAVAQAALLLEQQQKKDESLKAVTAKKATAEKATATQAAIAVEQQQKTADSLKAVSVSNDMAKNEADEKAALLLVQEQNEANEVRLAKERAEADAKAKAEAQAKAEEEARAESNRVAKLKEYQKTFDSLQLATQQSMDDSIRGEAAKKEAARKIEEAHEVMLRVLGQNAGAAPVSKTELPSKKAEEKGKIEIASKSENAVPDTGYTVVFKDGADTVQAYIPSAKAAQKADETGPDTMIIKEKPAADIQNETVPASTINKVAEPTLTKQEIPVRSKETPKFLDMEISHDTLPIVNAEKKSIEKPNQPAKELDKQPKANKTSGLTSNNSNTKIIELPAVVNTTAVAAAKPVNSSCREEATEKDFFSLRKKMAAAEDTDEMVNTARKTFREKCFTSLQVRNLCVLFLTDANKYRFLDVAYPHTSDQANFTALADMLSDAYYINRFNAMIR